MAREFPADFNDMTVYQLMEDDFMHPASTTVSDTQAWTALNDGATGTPVFQDAAGGWFNTVTAATDNDYSGYSSVTEPFKFAAAKPLWFEAQFKCSEATTSESTWWFGLTDTLTTGGMQANTGGPLTSYDGALIYKTPETAMTVNFQVSNTTVQSTLSAFATAISNTTHRVAFYFDGASPVGYVTPWFHNGTSWTAGSPLSITLASCDEMHVVWGIKAGPTAAAETLQLDYIRCVQVR